MPEVLGVLLLLTPLLAALACSLPSFEAEIEPLSKAAGVLLLGFAVLLAVRTSMATEYRGLHAILLVDPFSSVLILVVAVVGATALCCSPAIYAYRYPHLRLAGGATFTTAAYYRSLHLAIAALLLTVMVANLATLWLALAVAVLLTVRLSMAGTGTANVQAAWRQLEIRAVGMALAALALVCIVLAAWPHLGHSPAALDWPSLREVAGRLDGTLVRLAAILALLGFGSVSGLIVPGAWRSARTAGTLLPSSLLTQVGMPCCALYALLRCQALAAPSLGNRPAHLLLAAGLLAILPLVYAILVERTLPGLLLHAGRGQMALVAAAFGLGTAQGGFAGMLLLVAYALAASAVLPAAGLLCSVRHTTVLIRLGVGLRTCPALVALVLAGLATLGDLPPSAGFLGAFAVLDAALRAIPAAGAALLIGWILLNATLVLRVGQVALLGVEGASGTIGRSSSSAAPLLDAGVWFPSLPLAALVLLGLYIPDGLALLLKQAAAIVVGAG